MFTKQFKEKANHFKAIEYSSLTLAYLGDAVFDLYIRTKLIEKGNAKVNDLHKMATKYVSAKAQSDFIEELMKELSEEELLVYKRGRNAKSVTSPKNTDIIDYKRATGFEALLGYLYIKGDNERIEYLLEMIIEI
jgi:ribonuclease-3 family protein